MATMAPPSASIGGEAEKKPFDHDQEQQHVLQVGWKALFGFTTKAHLPILSGAMLSSVVAAGTLPIFSIFYGFIFNEYSDFSAGKIESNAFLAGVTRHCLILTGIASLNWLANTFYFFFFLTFGELQAKSARNRIFDALIQKDMAWYDTRDTGVAALLPAVQMHIRDLQLSVSAPFGESTQCIIMGIGALGVAFYFSWNLTLVVLCTIPLIYVFQTVIARRMSIRAYDQANKLEVALKYMTNAIQSIETVKCFNGETHELQIFDKVTAIAAKLYTRIACLRSIQIGVMQFFTLSVFVQGFWYGSHLVRSRQSEMNEVLTTFWAALLFINGITGFLPQFIVLQKGKVASARLIALMKPVSSGDQPRERAGETKPVRCLGDIEFRQVTFSYPTRADEIAIRNISIFFPAGETTFVIGRSGSGKSTLGQLLVRLYQPTSGEIFLDGHSLNSLDAKWLRGNVTLVEQHSVLFNDTIRQNIALGKCDNVISIEEIKDAIELALLEPIVQELPDGLNTELGMKGGSLSGGQKQRLALARSKVRDTPVLILDESTSALDHITRDSVFQAIRQWRKGRTTIIITHDISQIQSSDFIYLLDNAELVQEGYRKELEAQSGVFQALLAVHTEEDDYDDDASSAYSDETNEIISLYDEKAWQSHAPVHRPMSAVLFAENVLSPYSNTVRESLLGSIIPSRGKSNTTQEQVAETCPSEILSGYTNSMKLPPGMFLSSQGASQARRQSSRPTSQASLQSKYLEAGPFRQALPSYGEYGIRPLSKASSRPASRRLSTRYPRRLSVSDARSVRLRSQSRSDKRHNLLQRFDHQKAKESQATKSSANSLPITEILKSVWPMLSWRSRATVLVALLCALMHAAITPIFAWVFAQLLSTFYEPGDQSQRSLIFAMVILGLAIVDGVATYLLFFLADSVAQSWAHALKVEAMRRILMQPREFFDKEENSISRLAETLDHFAEEARNLPGRFAVIFISMMFMIAISVAWSLVISWRLALVALACGPVLFGITKTYNIISSHWERLANEADDIVGQILHETIVNIRTVRCLTLEEYFKAKHRKATTDAVNIGIKRALWSSSIFGLNFAAVLFVAILLFWYGALLAANRHNTIPEITETFLILMLSVNHINYIGHYITQVNMSREAGSRLIHLARMPTTSHEMSGNIKIQSAGDISFNKVNFTYPNREDVQVLHDVSFDIPRGGCTAIVGSSGSGKSTIASLLLKLYQTNSPSPSIHPAIANLTISNLDINSLDTTSLRSHMAIVSQTPTIFPGTIAKNIVYGLEPSSPLTSMDGIRAAADAAGISDFVDSLTNSYQTLIGEGGTGLSGGQAQRIAIARALVRDPDILILDEATSALDVASAGVVRDTIRKLVGEPICAEDIEDMSPRSRSGGIWDAKVWESGFAMGSGGKGEQPRKRMTVVIITHAREMMAIADQIVVLEKGRVVEAGSFSELKKRRGGAFGRLYRGERKEL